MMFKFGSKVWPGLAKLAEECGEVVQVIGKLIMIDGRADHWSGNMRWALIEEMADVKAAIKFIEVECLTHEERARLIDRENVKFGRFNQWHREQADG
jgi:NTP pyrophosphatase (non-canonical NTP hydrolase)